MPYIYYNELTGKIFIACWWYLGYNSQANRLAIPCLATGRLVQKEVKYETIRDYVYHQVQS